MNKVCLYVPMKYTHAGGGESTAVVQIDGPEVDVGKGRMDELAQQGWSLSHIDIDLDGVCVTLDTTDIYEAIDLLVKCLGLDPTQVAAVYALWEAGLVRPDNAIRLVSRGAFEFFRNMRPWEVAEYVIREGRYHIEDLLPYIDTIRFSSDVLRQDGYHGTSWGVVRIVC